MVTPSPPSAALDIGSNTIRLLVARVSDGEFVPVEDASAFVRLGRGVDASGRLQEDRIVAALEAIEGLVRRAREHGVDEVIAIATSAVRDASNREEFVRRVHDATSVDVTILSGDEEAQLTYLGAVLGNSVNDGAMICDLGGGSAELIFATASGVTWAKSLQIGSGRLSEQFIHHDPPQVEELTQVRAYVTRLLGDLPPAGARSAILTGGTATHIAVLLRKDGDRVELSLDDLERVVALVQSQSAAQLVASFGVRPERAEVLPAGVAAAAAIVAYYHTERVTITRHGIREGAILAGAHHTAL